MPGARAAHCCPKRHASGPRGYPGRIGARLPGLCPQQNQGLRGCRHPFVPFRLCARDRSRDRHRQDRRPQPGCKHPRHSDSASTAAVVRYRAHPAHHLRRQGRRRLPSLQRGWAGGGRYGISTLHALWCAQAARARTDPARGQERGRGRRQQHRRQADGADADAARSHRQHLPRQDPGPGAVHHPRRHPGRRGRTAEPHPSADGAHRRRRDRRRHQSARRRQAGRRRRFRRRGGESVLHHAGAGRRRADDRVDAARQHHCILRPLAAAGTDPPIDDRPHADRR